MMRIVVINGSPKGKSSNTSVMVSAFLKGAQTAGAETSHIFLTEKEIKHCKGCHICWLKGSCQCVSSDDMVGIIAAMGGANVIVFATPVYFGNISGMLKVFMDRMTMIGSPHSQRKPREDDPEFKGAEVPKPKLMMISNCGLPDRDEFQVISLWIKKVARKMGLELGGEIYATQGKYFTAPPKQYQSQVSNYLFFLEKAGREIAAGLNLSEETNQQLMRSFLG